MEGKTLRHFCQKHVGDRRGRPGARSGYCWVLLVDCPQIRARCQVLWWDVMPCWNVCWCDITKFTFPSHDSDLRLAVIAVWQSLPLILQQKSRLKTKVFKGRFLWLKIAGLLPGSYNQLLKWKKKQTRKSLWTVFSIPFSHFSLLGSLVFLCMSGLWLQFFPQYTLWWVTKTCGNIRPLRLLPSLSSVHGAVQELWYGRTDNAVLGETPPSHHTFHYETKPPKKFTNMSPLWRP